MSIETWKDEFFDDFEEACKNDEKSILHAIKKYNGAKKENLNKHNIIKFKNSFHLIDQDDRFDFDADSCALCYRHFEKVNTNEEDENDCSTCPLFLANGYPCESKHSAYIEFYNNNNPESMIEALENALEYVEKREN